MNGKKQDSDDGALPLTQHQRTSSIHVFDAVHAYEEPVGPGAAKDKIKNNLLMDLIAGVSIGFMVVPQGMSYALLAGVPPVWGLYGAFVPVFMYALLGSSRHLAVGPVAVTSLLLGTSLHRIVPAADKIEDASEIPAGLEDVQEQYNTAALQITFLVGLLWFVVGALQLGFLAAFLSHSVIAGFTAGAAITIGLSQVKYFLGLKLDRTDTAFENLIQIFKHIGESQWREFVMGFTFLVMLLTIKECAKRYKRLRWMRPLGPITVCIISIAAVAIGNLDGKELIKSVSDVPKGLPSATVQRWFPMKDFGRQIGTACIVFLVDFLESLSIAKAIARKWDYQINVNREIVAMGVANLVGGAFNAYTTTGSFSRTAVSSDIGARSPLQGVFTGTVVGFVLLFITPVFERLSYNATAAIIVSSVIGLFDFGMVKHLFHQHFFDFLVWLAAFLGTFFAGAEIGLGIAIGLALIIVVYRSAFPHTAVLGRLPDSNVWRNIKQYPMATQAPNICVVRVDAPLYFANIDWVRERVHRYANRAGENEKQGPIRYVILDMAPISFIDATGMQTLFTLVGELRKEGKQLVLSNPSRELQKKLKRAKILDEIGQDWVFVRTSDAVAMCEQSLREEEAVSVSFPAPAAVNQE